MEFYHGKNHDMWTKGCIPLGQFVTDHDYKLDLGVWINPRTGNPSFAIVYGPEGHQYISGQTRLNTHEDDYYKETIKRYSEYLKIEHQKKENQHGNETDR